MPELNVDLAFLKCSRVSDRTVCGGFVGGFDNSFRDCSRGFRLQAVPTSSSTFPGGEGPAMRSILFLCVCFQAECVFTFSRLSVISDISGMFNPETASLRAERLANDLNEVSTFSVVVCLFHVLAD